jgi:hypothetical protein
VILASALLATVACGGGAQTSGQSSPANSCAAVSGLTAPVNDKGTASLASTGTIIVDDEYFSPTCLSGANGTVTLTLHNRGRLLHNFSVPEQNIDVDIESSQTVMVKDAVGTKPLGCFCKYHRDAGQKCALLPHT